MKCRRIASFTDGHVPSQEIDTDIEDEDADDIPRDGERDGTKNQNDPFSVALQGKKTVESGRGDQGKEAAETGTRPFDFHVDRPRLIQPCQRCPLPYDVGTEYVKETAAHLGHPKAEMKSE